MCGASPERRSRWVDDGLLGLALARAQHAAAAHSGAVAHACHAASFRAAACSVVCGFGAALGTRQRNTRNRDLPKKQAASSHRVAEQATRVRERGLRAQGRQPPRQARGYAAAPRRPCCSAARACAGNTAAPCRRAFAKLTPWPPPAGRRPQRGRRRRHGGGAVPGAAALQPSQQSRRSRRRPLRCHAAPMRSSCLLLRRPRCCTCVGGRIRAASTPHGSGQRFAPAVKSRRSP